MKTVNKIPVLTLIIIGFAFPALAQETLPGITVVAANYKYFKAVNNKDLAEPVRMLERKAAIYDIKSSDIYEDDYDTYYVSFYIPQGYILATYDKDGKMIRTAEKFKDVVLPQAVRDAVVKRFPNWGITKDVYLVNYFDTKGVSKLYKLLLQNGGKRLRVKVSEEGEFKE